MSTSVMNQVAKNIDPANAADRIALIEQLCAARGSQYAGLKKYRNL